VQYGTYAFWVLTMCGHPDIRILDGARTRWVAEGRPLATDTPSPAAVEYRPQPADPSSRVGRDDVRAGLDRPDRLLLDARSPEEYRGDRVMPPPSFDHGAERTGRIPGAVHLHYRELLNEDDTFKSPEDLRAALRARAPRRIGERSSPIAG
jgi:thiosulfate/3-mercaptopyruvate sulfurtransferase